MRLSCRLAPWIVALALAAGGCGKYGPPERIVPAPPPGAAAADDPAPEKDADQEARP